MQLRDAVVPELQVPRPVRGVEGPARRSDGALHVLDGAVGGPARDFLAGGMDDIELGTAAGELQFPVDQHPLVAGQHAAFRLHIGHAHSFTNSGQSVSMLMDLRVPVRRGRPGRSAQLEGSAGLMPTAWRSWARNWSSSSLRTM